MASEHPYPALFRMAGLAAMNLDKRTSPRCLEPSGLHVFLAEHRQQYLPRSNPVVVVYDDNPAVGELLAVRIRHALSPGIKDERMRPGLTVVGRKVCRHVATTLSRLAGTSVLHHQKTAGRETANEESGRNVR